jgi:hypothetical protein
VKKQGGDQNGNFAGMSKMPQAASSQEQGLSELPRGLDSGKKK